MTQKITIADLEDLHNAVESLERIAIRAKEVGFLDLAKSARDAIELLDGIARQFSLMD